MVLSLPPHVTTSRLRLPLVTHDEATRMLHGERHASWHPDYPRRDDLDAASLVSAAHEDPSWGPRHVVRAFDGLVVGSIGFFGVPLRASDEVPEVEVGFRLVRDAWGHGAATESLRALLDLTDRLRVRVRAAVAPENRAGVRVLAKCGFTSLRGSDEDGRLVMARPI